MDVDPTASPVARASSSTAAVGAAATAAGSVATTTSTVGGEAKVEVGFGAVRRRFSCMNDCRLQVPFKRARWATQVCDDNFGKESIFVSITLFLFLFVCLFVCLFVLFVCYSLQQQTIHCLHSFAAIWLVATSTRSLMRAKRRMRTRL